MAAAVLDPTLLFVLASESALPDGLCSLDGLCAAQQKGPGEGFALRLFTSAGSAAEDLAKLPLDGRLTGDGRRMPDGQQLLCDAVLPRYEPECNWLGVYAMDLGDTGTYVCLDRFPLKDATNETCWFYPTHDGTYLSWERTLRIALQPGAVVDPSPELLAAPYDRDRISLLWSLLKDDECLTSVGLTYGGQRLEWGIQTVEVDTRATWSYFSVNSQMNPSLVVAGTKTIEAAAR